MKLWIAICCVVVGAWCIGTATAAPFYGPPVGAQKKACTGTWVPNLQVCKP